MNIREQVKELRAYSNVSLYAREREVKEFLRQAADTIEALSAKLAVANMERSNINKYDEMRKELKYSIIDLDADHYKLSGFMKVIDNVFDKYRDEICRSSTDNGGGWNAFPK